MLLSTFDAVQPCFILRNIRFYFVVVFCHIGDSRCPSDGPTELPPHPSVYPYVHTPGGISMSIAGARRRSAQSGRADCFPLDSRLFQEQTKEPVI